MPFTKYAKNEGYHNRMDQHGFRGAETMHSRSKLLQNLMTRLDDEIRDMVRKGRSIREIKMAKGVSQEHIKMAMNTPDGQCVAKQRGRKPKLTPEMMAAIEEMTLAHGDLRDEDLASRLSQRFGVKVHRTTVHRARHKLGFAFRPRMVIQEVTPEQCAVRCDFCNFVLAKIAKDTPIVFSDESRFCLSPDNSWIYIKRGAWSEASTVKKTKFPQGVMFFGAVGVGFKSKLVKCTGMVNAQEYLQLVRESGVIEKMNEVHGKFKWLFMQDGAPAHTSASATNNLGREVNFLPGWPPNSCDLNPIEVLWGIVKKRIKQQDLTELPFSDRVVAAWDSIPQSTIDSLTNDFRRRCQMCLTNRGKSISQYLSSHMTPQATDEPLPDFPFDADADLRLRELHAKHGNRWSAIAGEMNANPSSKPLQAVDCRRRYKVLIEREETFRKLTRHVLPGVETLIELVR